MKRTLIDIIRDIVRKTIAILIPVRWRSNALISNGGDRRSRARTTQGFYFVGQRDYQAGDSPRNIDRVTMARTGGQKMLTRLFEDPRPINALVVIDAGPTMNLGSVRVNKFELAAELASSIVRSALKTNDKVGMVLHQPGGVVHQIKPSSARVILEQTIAVLANGAIAETGKAGTSKTGNGLAEALSCTPRARSLVFIISDFLDMNEAAIQAIRQTAAIHQVICLVVDDPIERQLPAGIGFFPLFDIATGRERLIWSWRGSRKKYAENFAAHQERVGEVLEQIGCAYAFFGTEEDEAASKRLLGLLLST
jgi:uncharacterized protein (DUF58 family)